MGYYIPRQTCIYLLLTPLISEMDTSHPIHDDLRNIFRQFQAEIMSQPMKMLLRVITIW